MAYDEELAERIRELIAGQSHLTEKKMFGGLAFLVGGNMAVAASGQGGLMVRVDPADSERLIRTTKAEVMEMRGRAMTGWLRVATEDVRTENSSENDHLFRLKATTRSGECDRRERGLVTPCRLVVGGSLWMSPFCRRSRRTGYAWPAGSEPASGPAPWALACSTRRSAGTTRRQCRQVWVTTNLPATNPMGVGGE
jgi:TfoX/Sxy family transcriptional regulator of competence genes